MRDLSMFASLLEVLLSLAAYSLIAIVLLWTAGAIYFDIGRGRWFAWPLALGSILVVVIAVAFWQPLWKPLLTCAIALLFFLYWWFSQRPSNDRRWNPNYTALPDFEIDGDAVTVHNVRNTEYRTGTDFTPMFETRNYHLSQIEGIDGVIVFWGSPWLCHPMLVFDFGPQGRLCISIEVRYRVGQKYSFLASLYRQQEIMYVVSDERDAILKRTKYLENHDVYLYRLRIEPEEIRKVFLEYVVSANSLMDRPQWYHGLTTNCTTSIYRQRSREIDWDWRWLFNGKIDEMMYDHGRLDSSLPFAELKQQSRINELANRAPIEGFGDFIRRELPAYRMET